MAETPQEKRICFDSARTLHICSTKWVDSKVEVEGEDTGFARIQGLQRVLCRNFGLINLDWTSGDIFGLQGEWILTNKDSGHSNVRLHMYKIKCENIGFSKDSLLMQTVNFAVMFGTELDSEVLSMTMDLFVARTMTSKASLEFCGPMSLSLEQVN
ncbi:hypothetical protein L7F22_017269 [Adiantum nelumboides]|nr:hypothetical protein [Adiantum nelumboides]